MELKAGDKVRATKRLLAIRNGLIRIKDVGEIIKIRSATWNANVLVGEILFPNDSLTLYIDSWEEYIYKAESKIKQSRFWKRRSRQRK